MIDQRIDVSVRIHTSDIGHVVALRFEPVYKPIFIKEVMTCAVAIARVERTIKRNLDGMPTGKHRFVGIIIIEAGAAIGVVCLVSCDAGLEDDVLGASIVAHDKKDEAGVAVVGGQFGQVDAGNPAGGDLQGGGLGPVGAGNHAGHWVGLRNRLVDAGETAQRGDQAGANALVIASAEDIDGEAGSGGGYVEVDGIAMVDADLGAEAGDEIFLKRRAKIIPARGARIVVLDLNGIETGRCSGSFLAWENKYGADAEQEKCDEEANGQ